MDYFKGTYSFFRYPNEKFVGFSPFLGYLNIRSGFLRKAFDMKRTHGEEIYMERLIDEMFHSVQGNLTATINLRKPIYIIAKAELLNEFIAHVMINNIEGFQKKYIDKLIETQELLYTEFLNCECSKNKTIEKCNKNKTCSWSDGVRCQLKNTTSEIKNNKRQFKNKLQKFFILINNCIKDEDIFIPYYLLGLVLMSYWYLIKIFIYDKSEEEYFCDYKNTINKYINNDKKSIKIEEIDDYISKNSLINLPSPLLMIHANFDNINYPACFETVMNEFFNLLFYDKNSDTFIPKIDGFEVLPSLVDHYNFINENRLDYTSHFIINKFVKLTTNVPGIEYNNNGYEIKSNYDNFLIMINYFLNTDCEDLEKLLENINIEIFDFDKDRGILSLIIKGYNIELNINPGHSFSTNNNNKDFNLLKNKDELFDNFINFFSFSYIEEIDKNTTFVDLYILLNNNNISLPFYKHNFYVDHNIDKKIIKYLKINYSDISKIPNIKNIYGVNMSSNKIRILEEGVLFPNNLKFINLNYNKLEYLPELNHFPTNLEILYLCHNKLEYLPINIKFLEKLKELYLDYNNLEYLPENISFPDSLKLLCLNNNNLNSLPDNLVLPKYLKELYLNYNNLDCLPENIYFPDSLKLLYLNNNNLNSLPDNLVLPNDLEELYLNNNNLKKLPDNLVLPKSLKILYLNYNKLELLPDNISFPDKLKELFLHSNKLELLPNNISFPNNLTIIDLSNNNLELLPKNISFPKKIKKLILSYNNLISLTDENGNGIKFPESLEIIDCGYNKLKSLIDKNGQNILFPESLQELFLNDNELSLSDNKGYCVSFPDGLRVLNLNHNKLNSLSVGENHISFPSKLTTLYLNNTNLESLPSGITFPESLEILFLQNNKLKSLPENISFPVKLKLINLTNNPFRLKNLPLHIIDDRRIQLSK